MKIFNIPWKANIFLASITSFLVCLPASILLLDLQFIQNSETAIKNILAKSVSRDINLEKRILTLNVGGDVERTQSAEVNELTSLKPNFRDENAYLNYTASIVDFLLKNHVKGIVLNLDRNHRIDDSSIRENSLRKLIRKNSEKIILSAASYHSLSRKESYIPIYSNLISLQNDSHQSTQDFSESIGKNNEVEKGQGFLELSSRPKSLQERINPNLYGSYCPTRSFKDADEKDRDLTLYSAVHLANEQFFSQANRSDSLCKSFVDSLFPPIVQASTSNDFEGFQKISIEDICLKNIDLEEIFFLEKSQSICKPKDRIQNHISEALQDSIIIINFLHGEDIGLSLSEFENQPAMVQIQAALLSAVVSGQLYRASGFFINALIALFGSLIIVSWMTNRIRYSLNLFQYILQNILLLLAVSAIYFGVVVIFSYFNIFLPIAFPLIIWCTSGGVLITPFIFLKEREQRVQQEALKSAITIHLRKWSTRIASDIHDGPLQELKLVMDWLEELPPLTLDGPSKKPPSDNSEVVLDKVAKIGKDIRSSLDALDEALAISNNLQKGLIPGIEKYLKEQSERLTLEVSTDFLAFQEPQASAEWLDAREDIFRFFREAVNNAIRHGQPPRGNSTQLVVRIERSGNIYTLHIDNNVKKSKDSDRCHFSPPSNDVNSSRKEIRNGTGAKLMETIAHSIPQGAWERVFFEDGSVSTYLRWSTGK